MAHQFRFGLLLLPLFALGCPDTEARFNEFVDATKDHRPDDAEGESEESEESESGGTEETGDEALPDMNGVFLLALETSLGPDIPLQFITTVEFVPDDTGTTATGTFTIQPLSLDMGSQDTPREFVGDSLEYATMWDMNREYSIDMGLVMVTGAANPVTGSDIEATLVIDGHIVHIDAMCGTISGMLMSPLEYDLTGSTFAMMRLTDDGSNPATLPPAETFPYKCDMVGPAPGDGDGDTTDTGTDTSTDSGTESTT